ncbi:MAG: quinolinate phosphoribosyl transferase [Thermodesulfobacteriota bacterium]
MIPDIRETLFQSIGSKSFPAQITTGREGILAGSSRAAENLAAFGLTVDFLLAEGTRVQAGESIARFRGRPRQIALAEERIIGDLAKFSGIATAAARAMQLARGRCRIAAGAWKKMPAEIKDEVRRAVVLGGASPRLIETPFVYLDKNCVRMFGGIGQALQTASVFNDRVLVVQLKGETGGIREETMEAARGGADVIMVDTGVFDDAETALRALEELGLRPARKVAFAGELDLEDIPRCVDLGLDLLCLGKAIVDAPLLDMKLDVLDGKAEAVGN